MNEILDYNQVLEKLNRLTEEKKIYKEEPIGYTSFKLPILHYSIGSGKNHIVLSAAIHGCEIITTNFLLELMSNSYKWDFLDNVTLHFFPILNPEGYIITTSAIKRLIPDNINNKDFQTIVENYVKNYNLDNEDANNNVNINNKRYQKMFEDISYDCIPNEYCELKQNIKSLYEINSIPKGTLQVWSSNGNGIDLNQNCPYNNKLSLLGDHSTYGNLKYNNILATSPGPIGCPSKSSNFKYEPETNAFMNFLFQLKHDSNINLCAYLNYHSAEHTIYYSPATIYNNIIDKEKLDNMELNIKYNFSLAKLYSNITSHKLMPAGDNLNCFNDLLRLQIPGNLLIELCPNEGNPLSAFDKNFYSKIMEENVLACYNVLKEIPKIFKTTFYSSEE